MPVSIGGHLVARALAKAGVKCVFTLCGGHIAPIYDGCLREGIDIIDTRHEQAAAHAADAWARLSRGPGVAIVTAGPGVTDAVTGVANAHARAVAAGRPRRRRRAAPRRPRRAPGDGAGAAHALDHQVGGDGDRPASACPS